MNLPRHSEQIHVPNAAEARPAAPSARSTAFEDRDWHASSRDLAQGLVVQEFSETLPIDFADFA